MGSDGTPTPSSLAADTAMPMLPVEGQWVDTSGRYSHTTPSQGEASIETLEVELLNEIL